MAGVPSIQPVPPWLNHHQVQGCGVEQNVLQAIQQDCWTNPSKPADYQTRKLRWGSFDPKGTWFSRGCDTRVWQIFGYSNILEYFPIYKEGNPFSVNNMCTFFITNLHHHPPSSLLSKESWGWKFTSRLSGLHIWSCLSPRQPTLPPSPQNYSHHLSIILNKRDLLLLLNYTLSNNSWAGRCCIFLRLPLKHLWFCQILACRATIPDKYQALWATSPTCGLPTKLSKIRHSGSEKYVSSFIGARIKEMGDHCSLSMV